MEVCVNDCSIYIKKNFKSDSVKAFWYSHFKVMGDIVNSYFTRYSFIKSQTNATPIIISILHGVYTSVISAIYSSLSLKHFQPYNDQDRRQMREIVQFLRQCPRQQ